MYCTSTAWQPFSGAQRSALITGCDTSFRHTRDRRRDASTSACD